jgi:putative flippase GtrA
LNKYWTFQRKQRPTRREAGRFLLSVALELVSSNGLLWLAGMALSPFIANVTVWGNASKLLAVAVGAVLSYLIMRFWIDERRTHSTPHKCMKTLCHVRLFRLLRDEQSLHKDQPSQEEHQPGEVLLDTPGEHDPDQQDIHHCQGQEDDPLRRDAIREQNELPGVNGTGLGGVHPSQSGAEVWGSLEVARVECEREHAFHHDQSDPEQQEPVQHLELAFALHRALSLIDGRNR